MLFVASFHGVENDQDVEGSSRRFGGEERREASRDSRRMLDIRSVWETVQSLLSLLRLRYRLVELERFELLAFCFHVYRVNLRRLQPHVSTFILSPESRGVGFRNATAGTSLSSSSLLINLFGGDLVNADWFGRLTPEGITLWQTSSRSLYLLLPLSKLETALSNVGDDSEVSYAVFLYENSERRSFTELCMCFEGDENAHCLTSSFGESLSSLVGAFYPDI